MAKKALSKGIRKFIRKEKARIRREIFGIKEQERLINELYERFMPKEGGVEVKEAIIKKEEKKAEEKPKDKVKKSKKTEEKPKEKAKKVKKEKKTKPKKETPLVTPKVTPKQSKKKR